ncbi:EAL domain-containing protein [Erythrobacter sanguineus]|uniref:PAS domain S-box-containing protein/diguanylate cyclase (GGDEF) domain-containing protein n=1 Tax=Erythrobacter sanguineus TaxID=198312 RepID=A0A1M7SIE8_9SPHN|nr:EAL domain-containing protein [Erythrobacter sanguineus]SHN58251.1 PAS domain S-box-containing protein/diguanylate cyclase (GGDEF) domain-containing protein [Erythrobacter sanguineus]
MSGSTLRTDHNRAAPPLAERRPLALVADAGDKQSGPRRQEDRRTPDRLLPEQVAGLRTDATGLGLDRPFYLPRQMHGLAVSIFFALAIGTVMMREMPSLPMALAALVAVTIFAAGGIFSAIERHSGKHRVLQTMLVAVAVVLPMACAGFALAMGIGAGVPWQWAVATLVCINAAAAILFSGRMVSLFCAKLASWAGFAMAAPGLVTWAALAGMAATLALIARIEWRAAERRRVLRDARERVAARAEDILRSFEESGQGWFWESDRRGLLTYISPKVARVLGRGEAEMVGQPLGIIVNPGASGLEAERTLSFHLSARSAFEDVEVRAAAPGEERWWALTGRPVYDNYNNFCGFRGHGTDLTEQRRSEQQVTRLAHYDSLTGLANRVQMSQVLEQILSAPARRERACAVLMLDLDRFKQVNDTLGHPAGDALLKQVAQRLERVIGAQGRCGRLGGDEFKVIIAGEQPRTRLEMIAQEIITSLSKPYSVNGQSVVIGASVGIARAPVDGTTCDEIIRNVDLALYAAKDAGRGCCRFYAADLHAAVEERAALEQDLRDAVARGELQLFYQPVVYAASETIVGFEALMRWQHPTRGALSPSKFVPVAEDAGLIDRLGQWALRTACADLAKWPENISCSVNVSALQFANPELPTIIANALAHSGVDPARLELEITESVFLNDTAGIETMFRALKDLGVRLALDDFGTGYSSLGYLRKAPFDRIKIDRSFVRGASEQGSRNGAIIASITSLAEVLQMDTTAEGVETHDELELVRLLGCSHVQGHIYFTPMNAAEAGALASGSLIAKPSGPQSARAERKVLLRRVAVMHKGVRHNATLRNISEGGAMIEGLWSMAQGQVLRVDFSATQSITGQVRWSSENCVGIEFHLPLKRRNDGSYALLRNREALPGTTAA